MAILATQKVLTLDYWKPASQLQVGDYVFDRKGKPVQITLIQQYRSERCYEVTFDDLMTISGDIKLDLPIESKRYRAHVSRYKNKKQFRRPLPFHNVEYLLNQPLKESRRFRFSVPTADPLQLPHQDLPVPPFVFGFWFMNRKEKGHMYLSSRHAKYVEQKFKDAGYKLVYGIKAHGKDLQFRTVPEITSQLFPPNPSRIPNNYLLASTEQRLELLAGLVHGKTRQYSVAKDRFVLTYKFYGAFMGMVGLIESLGLRTKTNHDERRDSFSVFFKSRHRLVENQVSPPVKVHMARRYIHHIEPIASQLCVHIQTDGDDNSILVGEGFISCR